MYNNEDRELQLVFAYIVEKEVYVNSKQSAIVHFIGTHTCCESNYFASTLMTTMFPQIGFENKPVGFMDHHHRMTRVFHRHLNIFYVDK